MPRQFGLKQTSALAQSAPESSNASPGGRLRAGRQLFVREGDESDGHGPASAQARLRHPRQRERPPLISSFRRFAPVAIMGCFL
jgi:hypothetical protein